MTALPTILVSGAAGPLGRRVIELLRERQPGATVIAGSRTPEVLGGPGIETRRVDLTDATGLAAAYSGVDRLLLISLGVAGPERVRLQRAAIDAARAAGVGHIVYTSGPNPEGSPIPLLADHLATEQALAASGIPHTNLRNVWYAENLLGTLPPVLASGQWFTSAGDGRVAHVTREDCARAAAGALLAAGGDSRTFTVTGETALTVREIAAIATEVTGRPIEVVDLDDTALAAVLRRAGVPEPVIANFIVPFERNTREGRVDITTDTVERLWGTRPQWLRDFLARHRAALG